jgi:hypothetical protein
MLRTWYEWCAITQDALTFRQDPQLSVGDGKYRGGDRLSGLPTRAHMESGKSATNTTVFRPQFNQRPM